MSDTDARAAKVGRVSDPPSPDADELTSKAGRRPALPQTQRANPWRSTVVFSAVAIAAFVGVRWLPISGGSLHYTDLRVGDKNFLEFCEPGGPQFVPVDRVHSPITLALDSPTPLRAGEPAQLTARLVASSGKPVTVDDLLVVHTEKLHLLVVDATLDDYQHIHPRPTGVPGEFAFPFTPRRDGAYRVFADFTPAATGRALYAGASLEVAPRSTAAKESGRAANQVPRLAHEESLDATLEGYRYTLAVSKQPLHANEGTDLTFTIARAEGDAPVVLEPVMGAPAHVVAFDENCTGFAHLHPLATPEAAAAASAKNPSLQFALKLTDAGFYRVWAQVKIEGRERFVPFGLRVER